MKQVSIHIALLLVPMQQWTYGAIEAFLPTLVKLFPGSVGPLLTVVDDRFFTGNGGIPTLAGKDCEQRQSNELSLLSHIFFDKSLLQDSKR